MGLDLKAYLKRYHAKGERRYDFSAIEKRFAPLREGRKCLTANDVLWLLHPDNAPFGDYWPAPNKKHLDQLSKRRLRLGLDSQNKKDVVRELLGILHNIGVTSIVLRCTHPDCFGVFSTPVLNMLQLSRNSTVEIYLAYCDELSEWKSHFHLSSVADAEMAITALDQIIKYDEKESEAAQKSVQEDLWVQRRRAANVLRPFLKDFGSLQLARILLDEHPRLAGMIAGAEYERLLGVASLRFLKRELTSEDGANAELLRELQFRGKISKGERVKLNEVWEIRNKAVHGRELPPPVTAVNRMIDNIEKICGSWTLKSDS
jgi:hypothetical protein